MMGSYTPVDPRAFGQVYPVPGAIRRLPVDLLRTALVTRQPQRTAAAAEEYRAVMEQPTYSPPVNMPQRLMFQQHKSALKSGVSRGDKRPAYSSADAYSAAVHPTMLTGSLPRDLAGLSAVPALALRVPERVPTFTEAAAARARGGDALPIPEVDFAPVPLGIPVRVRPIEQRIGPPAAVATTIPQRGMPVRTPKMPDAWSAIPGPVRPDVTPAKEYPIEAQLSMRERNAAQERAARLGERLMAVSELLSGQSVRLPVTPKMLSRSADASREVLPGTFDPRAAGITTTQRIANTTLRTMPPMSSPLPQQPDALRDHLEDMSTASAAARVAETNAALAGIASAQRAMRARLGVR